MDFHWKAFYNDGTVLEQNGPRATYADIVRDELNAFGLYNPGGEPIVLIDFRDDSNGDPDIGPKRLIWRIRHRLDTKGERIRVHLVGWQRKVKGRNIQSICYINEDGVVVLGGQWVTDRPFRYPIVTLECEADLLD